MKKVLIALLAPAILLSACQTLPLSEVPDSVEAAFNTLHPDANKVKWSSEVEDGATIYEAEFKENKQEKEADFAADGTWLETETEIEVADLPAAVAATLQNDYPNHTIEEAEMVENNENAVVYEVEIEDEANDSELEVVLDPAGNVLSVEVEDDDED